VDRPALGGLHGTIGEVDRLAEHVQHPPERGRPDRHHDGRARVDRLHPALQAVGRLHGHRAHAVLAQVLLDLRDDVDRLALHVTDDPDRVVQPGQVALLELDVDHGPITDTTRPILWPASTP